MSDPTQVTTSTPTGGHGNGPVLLVEGLSGGYDGGDVFRDVQLALHAGKSVRVVGPNAAGKSTLVRCLAGIKHPRTGRVSICGHDLATDPVAAKRHLGYSTGNDPFTYLSGREHLRLASRIHQLAREHEARVLDRFSNWPVVRAIDNEVRRYSHGMRQQLSVLLAVIHDPCLLLLDEAVDGFDDDVLADWSAYLGERSRAGRSLLFVEHRDEVAAAFPAARQLQLAGCPVTNPPVEVADDARA